MESLSAIHNSQGDSQDYLAVLVVQNMKENNTTEENRETIRVVYLEPGRLARTEGKINGMRPCRAVYGEDGRVSDIIFGPFFIQLRKEYYRCFSLADMLYY